MEEKAENIFTSHTEVLQRQDKESLLKQRAQCLWLTGLSGSGKSSIARAAERILHDKGFAVMLLDGDNVRDGLNKNLGFSEEGRNENIRRIAEVNKLFNNCGIITINAFVSPTDELRNMARQIIGTCFHEIFVNTPLAVCEQRDIKGLYAKARKGEIPNFTGISAPFDTPKKAEFEVSTEHETVQESAQKLVDYILPKLQLA